MPEDPLETEQEEVEADAAFVQESSSRIAVLFQLIEGPMGPEGIADSTEISADQARDGLDDLTDRDLAEVFIADDEPNGPVYGATLQGEKVAFHIKQEKR